ncbi:hypothetical protein [Variovorax sp. 38R]|uniref:hypothetical protein n=1 Tax=Variovorax sp. 38R TaxID=2774875 RepID=UPI00177ED43B|nr:hypothetical protein [Variovorax sp. 38R]QOF77604.1 hypothetical protein IG196_25170 [Variovorax sp. 38R]
MHHYLEALVGHPSQVSRTVLERYQRWQHHYRKKEGHCPSPGSAASCPCAASLNGSRALEKSRRTRRPTWSCKKLRRLRVQRRY